MKLRSRARQRGFTLIEMLIVIVVMGVLLALAIPSYNTTITRSKEARLHHNLFTLNKLIQQYSLDKKQAPQQLDDLITAGYLKFIPDELRALIRRGKRIRKILKKPGIANRPASHPCTAARTKLATGRQRVFELDQVRGHEFSRMRHFTR